METSAVLTMVVSTFLLPPSIVLQARFGRLHMPGHRAKKSMRAKVKKP